MDGLVSVSSHRLGCEFECKPSIPKDPAALWVGCPVMSPGVSWGDKGQESSWARAAASATQHSPVGSPLALRGGLGGPCHPSWGVASRCPAGLSVGVLSGLFSPAAAEVTGHGKDRTRLPAAQLAGLCGVLCFPAVPPSSEPGS